MASTSANIISGLALPEDVVAEITSLGATLLLDNAAERKEEALSLAPQADIWFGPGLSADVLHAGTRLRWFQTSSVGIEYFMYPELVDSDVVVTNMRGRHTAVSEHAIGLMLSLARQLPRMTLQQNERIWKMPTPDETAQLSGSKALVLGTGQIGGQIAERLNAFGVTVAGINRTAHPVPGFQSVAPLGELREAVADADWIVNALPLTDLTRGIVSAEVLDAAKRGAFFVNVGRGKTVDQDALLAALDRDQIRAAALDCFASEPLAEDHPFWTMPNVLITPHAAGVIPGSSVLQLSTRSLIDNLRLFVDGVPVHEPVDKRLGY